MGKADDKTLSGDLDDDALAETVANLECAVAQCAERDTQRSREQGRHFGALLAAALAEQAPRRAAGA